MIRTYIANSPPPTAVSAADTAMPRSLTDSTSMPAARAASSSSRTASSE